MATSIPIDPAGSGRIAAWVGVRGRILATVGKIPGNIDFYIANSPQSFSTPYEHLTKPDGSKFQTIEAALTYVQTNFSATSTVNYGAVGWADVTGKPAAASKRLENYEGNTNAQGVYTVVFATPYAAIPNIYLSLPNQTDETVRGRITSVSKTGFTINVFKNTTGILSLLTVLLAATTPVAGATVNVLISEK